MKRSMMESKDTFGERVVDYFEGHLSDMEGHWSEDKLARFVDYELRPLIAAIAQYMCVAENYVDMESREPAVTANLRLELNKIIGEA